IVLEPFGGELGADGPENLRAHGEIEGADTGRGLGGVEEGFELVPALLAQRIDRAVVEAGKEALHRLGLDIGGGDVALERLVRETAVILIAARGARNADDARGVPQLSVEVAVIDGRQELALRQIARAAEDDIVELVDLDDLAGHL